LARSSSFFFFRPIVFSPRRFSSCARGKRPAQRSPPACMGRRAEIKVRERSGGQKGGKGEGEMFRMTSESTPLSGILRQNSYKNVKEGDQTGSRCNRRGLGWRHRPREQYIPAAHSRRKRRVRLNATPRRWQRQRREGRQGVGVSGRDTRFMPEMV